MTVINNGGPAFPQYEETIDLSEERDPTLLPLSAAQLASLKSLASQKKGMSLRDYFAGQAMVGMLANPKFPIQSHPKVVAKEAYVYADKLIKQKDVIE